MKDWASQFSSQPLEPFFEIPWGVVKHNTYAVRPLRFHEDTSNVDEIVDHTTLKRKSD
jgi:hypothetical protein